LVKFYGIGMNKRSIISMTGYAKFFEDNGIKGLYFDSLVEYFESEHVKNDPEYIIKVVSLLDSDEKKDFKKASDAAGYSMPKLKWLSPKLIEKQEDA